MSESCKKNCQLPCILGKKHFGQILIFLAFLEGIHTENKVFEVVPRLESQLCHSVAVGSLTSYLKAFSCSFLICKMSTIIVLSIYGDCENYMKLCRQTCLE